MASLVGARTWEIPLHEAMCSVQGQSRPWQALSRCSTRDELCRIKQVLPHFDPDCMGEARPNSGKLEDLCGIRSLSSDSSRMWRSTGAAGVPQFGKNSP